MEAINITKKKLKETVREQTFTGGRVKINVLWFDWKDGEYIENGITKRFCGAKYMVASMLTKKETLDHMHRWLTMGMIGYNPNVKIWVAETDAQRKKMPLSFNWNAY